MLVGLNVNVMPVAAGDTVAESATLPVKPRLLDVIVEVADCPEVIVLGLAALAASVKSPAIVIEMVAVWDTVPVVPVTVTVYDPAGVAAVVEMVRVDVPVDPAVRLILVGLNVKVIPVAAGDTAADSATLPVNPRLLAAIVGVADPPAVNCAGDAALAESVKSLVTVNVMVAV